MFHQVFICDTTEEPECSRSVIAEQNSVSNATPQTLKQESITSGNTTMGYIPADNFKMSVDELKLEQFNVINNQLAMKTDSQVTQEDIETKNSLNVMMPSCSNIGSPMPMVCVIQPPQIVVSQPPGQTYVYQPSAENIVLQPQPTLIKMNDDMSALPVLLQTGAVVDPVTGLGQQPAQHTQNPAMKIEPLINVMDISSSVTAPKPEQNYMTSSQVKKEEPMEDGLHQAIADSGVTEAHPVGIESQGDSGVITKEETKPLLEETNESVPNVQQSIKSRKFLRFHLINSGNFKLKKILDVNTCLIAKNDSPPEYITADLSPDDKMENANERSSKKYHHSSSDSEEEHFGIDESSGSDWEEEYSRERLKIKNKLKINILQKSNKKIVNSMNNTNHTRQPKVVNDTQYNVKNVSATKATNEIKVNNTNSRRILPVASVSSSTAGNMRISSLCNNESGSNTINSTKALNTNILVAKSTSYHLPQLNPVNNTSRLILPKTVEAQNSAGGFVPIVNNCENIVDFQDNSNRNSQYQTLVLAGPIDPHKNKKGDNANLQTCVESNQNKQIISSNAVQGITEKDNEENFRKILPKPTLSYTFGVIKMPSSSKPSPGENAPNGNSGEGESPSVRESVPCRYLYHCKECDKCFQSLEQYFFHKQNSLCFEKKKVENYQCDICGKRLASEETLKDHKHWHADSRPYKCSFCDERYNSKAGMDRHYKKKHYGNKCKATPYVCSFCGKKYAGKNTLLAHEEIHRLPEGAEIPKPYVCEECGKQFRCNAGLNNHLKFHAAPSYFCNICDKGFKNKPNLIQHMITHSEARPISCLLCGDRFKRKTHLKQHRMAVHGKGRIK